MFKMLNKGAKIGACIGISFGVIGGLVGILVVALSPVAWYTKLPIIIGIIVFEAGLFTLFYVIFKKVLGPVVEQRKLLNTGTPAEATILSLKDTGVVINYTHPVVKLTLEVRPPGGQPYQAQLKTMVSLLQAPQIQPGSVVPVVYDPSDPSKLALGKKEEPALADGAPVTAPAAPGGIAPAAGTAAASTSEAE